MQCHLGKEVIKKFNLEANNKSPQQYGLGFKEIWEINSENHQLGKIMHSVGWPLENDTYRTFKTEAIAKLGWIFQF